jgi:hypothetical protein
VCCPVHGSIPAGAPAQLGVQQCSHHPFSLGMPLSSACPQARRSPPGNPSRWPLVPGRVSLLPSGSGRHPCAGALWPFSSAVSHPSPRRGSFAAALRCSPAPFGPAVHTGSSAPLTASHLRAERTDLQCISAASLNICAAVHAAQSSIPRWRSRASSPGGPGGAPDLCPDASRLALKASRITLFRASPDPPSRHGGLLCAIPNGLGKF